MLRLVHAPFVPSLGQGTEVYRQKVFDNAAIP